MTHILGQFGDGEGGVDPCPNFLAHKRSEKVVQVDRLGGSWGRGNLDKIQKKKLLFFREAIPNLMAILR